MANHNETFPEQQSGLMMVVSAVFPFVEDVVTEGYDFDEMYDDLVVLDQYYLDFIDAHNALIGIINLQADE